MTGNENPEAQPLLSPQKPASIQEPITIRIANGVGWWSTFLAMVPQGLLAALLADKFFKSIILKHEDPTTPEQIARALVDLVAYFTAFAGKYRLIRFFNTESFKELGKPEFWKNNLNPKNWTALEAATFVLNMGLATATAMTFGYIGKVSFDGISDLLFDYKNPFTDFLAHIAKNFWVQLPFISASVLCNLLAYPGIHKIPFYVGQRALNAAVHHQEYQAAQAFLIANIRAVRKDIATLRANGTDPDNMFYKMGIPVNLAGMDRTIAAGILKSIKDLTPVQIARANYHETDGSVISDPRYPSWAEFIVGHSVGAVGTAISTAGFYNFTSFGAEMAKWLIPEITEPYASIVGYLVYASLSCLGLTVWTNIVDLASQLFRTDTRLDTLSKKTAAWIIFLSTTVAVLGGMPNVYQSYLANLPAILIMASAAASALVELPGFFHLTRGNYERAAAEDPKNGVIQALNNRMDAAIAEVGSMSPDEVAAQVKALPGKEGFETPPKYRECGPFAMFGRSGRQARPSVDAAAVINASVGSSLPDGP